jgi:hypothetical protein
MVSPGNRGDETCGGILSKDFGFRRRCAAAGLGLAGCPRAGILRLAFSTRRRPPAGRRAGCASRSQLCVWYDLIVDGQVNVF